MPHRKMSLWKRAGITAALGASLCSCWGDNQSRRPDNQSRLLKWITDHGGREMRSALGASSCDAMISVVVVVMSL